MKLRAALSGLPAAGALRFADVMLVGVVMAVVGLLILPLPTLVLDILIAINITLGVLLLLSTLYVAKPLDFSTFPTVLLLSTLFRLSLSIATTRMILTQAEAGHIVHQFGMMVAGGNLIVGLVVFLIITVVQFIVISKGAERVAEVAARFSLDAMPGKQLSIDSDLRSGLIGKDEARSRRRTLELESKLHGSLDGAMKFVKGDAIASIIIVLVNLIGGLGMGVLSHGMSAGEAIETYSILTIGDGLVAQLPALLAAMAAGLLVTRTTDEENDRDLAPAIARQIASKPRVLFTAAGLCTLIGFIPGFPTLVFLGIAAALGFSGALRTPVSKAWIDGKFARFDTRIEAVPERVAIAPEPLGPVRPLVIEIARHPLPADEMHRLRTAVGAMLQRLQHRIGLPLPAAEIVHVPSQDSASVWALYLYDAPAGSGRIDGDDLEHAVCEPVEAILRRNLGQFLGLQEVTAMLNALGVDYPDVVKEAVRAVSAAKIAEVLRLLAEEEVSLRNMRDVLEAIAEAGQSDRNALPIADRTRLAMKRYLSPPLCVNGRMKVLIIGLTLEHFLRDNVRQLDGIGRLAMNPEHARTLIDMIRREVNTSHARAVVVAQDLRRPLRRLLGPDLFEVPVLSFNELSPSIPLDVVGQLDRTPLAVEDESRMEAAE
ncbi:type III secretion protein V [Novosphingobium chloroacetimidivorans]|uniref:Type III secretion protein V n=1 Tax=Novosphingobium chloroacetimidivorans TaxID=1428314 RepID=A0A7W7NW02_9SPHN|nr:flagellar biosynthesis protein FlhA [Novosphingobium chloroacetimidivorans]MBB4858846.1 type III secretion protein V [Novosphingobium chloroacetimidivorans]